MNERFIVKCIKCGDNHTTEEIEFLNVEEDLQGRDVCYFVCPATQEQTKSLIYKD